MFFITGNVEKCPYAYLKTCPIIGGWFFKHLVEDKQTSYFKFFQYVLQDNIVMTIATE